MSDTPETNTQKDINKDDSDKNVVAGRSKQPSERQLKHLEYARKKKADKAEIKAEQNRVFVAQLKDIYTNITGMSNRINTLNENVIGLMETYGAGGTKRKREEKKKGKEEQIDDDEDTEEFEGTKNEKKKFDQSKDTATLEVSTNVTETQVGGIADYSGFYKIIGQLLGAGLGMAALWGYKEYRSSQNDHPRKFLYKNIQ